MSVRKVVIEGSGTGLSCPEKSAVKSVRSPLGPIAGAGLMDVSEKEKGVEGPSARLVLLIPRLPENTAVLLPRLPTISPE